MSEKEVVLEGEKSPHPPSDSPGSGSIIGTNEPAIFEEYLHYAARQRHAESVGSQENQGPQKREWFEKWSDYKGPNVNIVVDPQMKYEDPPMTPQQEEVAAAARSLRLASWASAFYLITTDILGPFNAPYAIGQVGWVPGILLYFFMAAIALYAGLVLWRLYVRLDSLRYPCRSYSDIVDRIYGKRARQVTTFLQNLQLVVVVAVNCLANGQSFSQIVSGKVCFAICIIIWVFVGIILGQIRSLKTYSWIANLAVCVNVVLICISMGFIAHSPPNFDAAQKSLGVPPGPVMTQIKTSLPLPVQVTGIMNMVFAYGGSMIFPEIMAEMRRPMDFWKGMTLAQLFIFCVYILYGTFIYAFQGQFALPLAYQGIGKHSFQVAGNVLGLLSSVFATALYGNIGAKVIYRNIVEEYFRGPQLMSLKGYFIWSGLVIFYWAIAFVIGSAIPQVQTITSLIASIAIMQFTYTFPAALRFGYDVLTDAMVEDSPFVPGKGSSGRVDGWHQWSRWKRGLFGGMWYFKLFNFLIAFAGLAMACLGMWGSGVTIKMIFDTSGAATSFGCASPVA